jgi:hypothetical protein
LTAFMRGSAPGRAQPAYALGHGGNARSRWLKRKRLPLCHLSRPRVSCQVKRAPKPAALAGPLKKSGDWRRLSRSETADLSVHTAMASRAMTKGGADGQALRATAAIVMANAGGLKDETATAQELYDRMLALYPDRINPGSLWGSVNAAKAARQAKA